MRSPEASSFVLEAASAAAPGRREVKFSLPNVDAGKFRSILAVNCRRVSYADATSRVCSIYFDDAALSALRANLDGTSRRTKTRIRWYDTPFPEKRFFFEVKRREDEALLHGPEQIADLPVPVAESPGAVRIGHPERSHLVEYLAPNSVFNSLPRQRSSPHLRPDDRLVTIDRVLHHASLGVA